MSKAKKAVATAAVPAVVPVPAFKPIPEQLMYGPFFDLVKDKKNWKEPIDCEIEAPREQWHYDLFVRMIEEAVAFYAGGGAEVFQVRVLENGWRIIRVMAPGYYALIGA